MYLRIKKSPEAVDISIARGFNPVYMRTTQNALRINNKKGYNLLRRETDNACTKHRS